MAEYERKAREKDEAERERMKEADEAMKKGARAGLSAALLDGADAPIIVHREEAEEKGRGLAQADRVDEAAWRPRNRQECELRLPRWPST